MEKIISFYIGMQGIDTVIESVLDGVTGGIHRINYPPGNGKFGPEFLIDLIRSNQGDNDFDYELGRLGYEYLTSKDGLSDLALEYLSQLSEFEENEYVTKDVLENIKQSLLKIIK